MVSPATTPTVSGRNNGTQTTSAVNPTKSPFEVIWSRNCGPRPDRPAPVTRTATAIMMGTAASAASIAQVRQRRKSTESSDPSSDHPVVRLGSGASVSLFDIEALPGESDEPFLQRRGVHGETADAHALGHE